MSPRWKTTGIVATAAGVIVAALLLSHVTPRKRAAAAEPVATSGGMGVGARMESTYVLLGEHEAHLALTLQAPEVTGARPPLHVGIVIDHSGSMAGDKIEHARRAAAQLVGQLGPGDRFTVIAYGSDVDVVFADSPADAASKRAALAAIDRIYDDGGTNLSGGLLAAVDQLRGGRAMPGAVSRIVLISDGIANEGIINHEDLAALASRTAEQGVSLTTVGVGLDFDEQLMTAMAVSGRGNYYFVESSDQLAAMFGDEFSKLGATAATDVQVAVAPADGVVVLDAYGYPMHAEGGKLYIPVADMHSGEQRKIVLRLRVNATRLGAMDVGRVETSFFRVATASRERSDLLAAAVVTDDPRQVADHLDREAVRHVERALTARAIDEATVLYEQGRGEAAQKVLQQRAEDAKGVAEQMNWEGLDVEINGAVGRAEGNFAAAPRPTSDAGKHGRKSNRADAYDLMMK